VSLTVRPLTVSPEEVVPHKPSHSFHSLLVGCALVTLAWSPARLGAEPAPPPNTQPALREIEIVVAGAYQPSRVELHEGERVRLKFIRKDYGSCTREVVFAKLDIRRELPTGKPVLIDLPALAPGEYTFQCGMNMIRGTLVVLAKAEPAKPAPLPPASKP